MTSSQTVGWLLLSFSGVTDGHMFKDILLDHMGVIKYVDFGAAKIIAKNHRTLQRTRRGSEPPPAVPGQTEANGQFGVNNSLTGTPMYMSPEVIRNNKQGRHGAMDIWSLGCVVLECATGRKPWSNLDNEWCVESFRRFLRGKLTFVHPTGLLCSISVSRLSILRFRTLAS